MTREEAINIIRDTYHTDTELEALKVLLPEIAESEGERIIQELKEAFEVYDIESKWNGIPIRSILAWLEKQKINTEGDFARGYDCGYEACLNSHGAEWLEKQKEPMPAWSEEDEKTSTSRASWTDTSRR